MRHILTGHLQHFHTVVASLLSPLGISSLGPGTFRPIAFVNHRELLSTCLLGSCVWCRGMDITCMCDPHSYTIYMPSMLQGAQS